MEITEIPQKKKEDRCELRKKAKRFEQSRDNLKAKNRGKAGSIKKLSDRLNELESSRNHWRKESSKVAKKCRLQEEELKRAASKVDALQEEREQLRKHAELFKAKK